MSQPVIVLPVPGNGIPDHLGLINVVVLVDHTFGAFDDPGQNRTACLVIEVIGIVLDVRFSGDFSIERDNDQPTPGTGIHGTDLGQVIGIEDERMAGHIAEGVLILFLSVDFVGGAELLHIGCVQAHTLLQLGSDDEPLSLGLGQLRFHVPFAAHCQRIGGHIATVGAEHPGDGVPEGRLAIASLAVSDNQGLNVDLANSSKTDNLLYIIHELPVTKEKGVERILPDVRSGYGRVHTGLLGDKIRCNMVMCSGQPQSQIIGERRGVQQEFIRIQFLLVDLQLGPRFL